MGVPRRLGRALGSRLTRHRPAPAFVCPRCGKASWHPEDGRQGYCNACCWWTGDLTLGAPQVIAQAEAEGVITPIKLA